MTTGPVAMAPNAALVCIAMSGDISMVFSVVWLGTDCAAPEHWLQRLCDETRFKELETVTGKRQMQRTQRTASENRGLSIKFYLYFTLLIKRIENSTV